MATAARVATIAVAPSAFWDTVGAGGVTSRPAPLLEVVA